MFLKGGDFSIERLVALSGILKFTGCQEVVSLRGREQSLRIAENFTGITETVHGGFEGGKRPLTDKGQMVGTLPHDRDLTLQRGDLGSTQESRTCRLARGAAMGDTITTKELAGACREGKSGIGSLQTESRLQIGDDHHSLEKTCDESVCGTGCADNIRCPRNSALGERSTMNSRDRKKVTGNDRSASLDGLTKRLKG